MVTRYTQGQARSSLEEDALSVYVIPLTEMRVWDSRATVLPAAALNDDMGLITGTFGTDIATLQSIDFKAGATDEKCAFHFRLPVEYVSGATITVRLRAGMVTTISDQGAGGCTVDVECYESDRDGAVGADLCATAAQNMNVLVHADKDFTITPTTLAAGDLLDFRLSFAGTDVATGTAVIAEISQVELLLDVKG